MHRRFSSLWSALLMLSAVGAAAADRPLPALDLVDQAGLAANVQTIEQSNPWVLLVVDGDKTLTPQTLSRLERQTGGWNGQVVIVVVGSDAAFTKIVNTNAKLQGVVWYRDNSGDIVRQLNIPGTPSLLGIHNFSQIAWQVAGLPEQTARVESLVSSWINAPVPPPSGNSYSGVGY